MKTQIFGRKAGSGDEFKLLFESDRASSGGMKVDPAKLREFELNNTFRAIEMLQTKQFEGYVVFEGGAHECKFTPDLIEQSSRQQITKLAEVLFPSDDYYSRELMQLFSEMHEQHLIGGGNASLVGLGNTLSTFTPRYFLMETSANKEKTEQRWLYQRKQLFDALEKFFLDGGLDKQLVAQETLLTELEVAGTEIEGRRILVDGLKGAAGRWHQAFISFAIMGRPRGVGLTTTAKCDCRAIEEALRKAGFSNNDILQLKNGSRLFEMSGED